jgi:nicotinamidase-related amidase
VAPPALLITQCLQNDFVKAIGRFDPIPNKLHVGFSEAQRLLGEDPASGPVARHMKWAHAQPDDVLKIIHIRDWHDPEDPAQAEHLSRFGHHCLRETSGADFAFPEPDSGDKDIAYVNTLTLNDFNDTNLAQVLDGHANEKCRVGIIGVWTEAKVSFLAYELATRYPQFQLAVCSALAASSTRHHHFEALDQLERILGVQVFDSTGDFEDFLAGRDTEIPLEGIPEKHPVITTDGFELEDVDRTLVRYLFRHCRSVALEEFGGGFSGNVVAGTKSVDLKGHHEVPHVIKIGDQKDMGKERAGFERVQEVLGNNAPHVSAFVDYEGRGAIKYRYASMGGDFSTTFQKFYQEGGDLQEVEEHLDTIFGEQLMRFYRAAQLESGDLLEHYEFSSKWAPGVRQRVEDLIGQKAEGRRIEIHQGTQAYNLCDFYEDTLERLPPRPPDSFYQAYVHGDLNGQNIILDGHKNLWLIDFFHTGRAHVLKDLIKMESDLLFIFTPVENDNDFKKAAAFTNALMEQDDLAAPLPEKCPVEGEQFERAWRTVRKLRSFYPELIRSDRKVFQLRVAQLRYAAHTIGWDEPSLLQRKWALYTACR